MSFDRAALFGFVDRYGDFVVGCIVGAAVVNALYGVAFLLGAG